MFTAKITSKGRITLPKEGRRRLGIGPGDEVEFLEENGKYMLTKNVRESPLAQYRGYLKHLEGSNTDEIMRELRGE